MFKDYSGIASTLEEHFNFLVRQRSPRTPVKVAFFAHRYTFWHSFRSVVLECRSRPRFSVSVVPSVCEEGSAQGSEREVAWLEAHDIPWIPYTAFNPLKNPPDVLFFQTPYAHNRPEYMHPEVLLLKDVRCALIPYCTEALGGNKFAYLYFGVTPCFWRTFAASSLSQKLYRTHQNVPETSVPITGNPEYDYADHVPEADMEKYANIKTLAKGRRILLWTPHYATSKVFRWCTWEQLGLEILQSSVLFKKDIFVVLRPHHLLRSRFQAWKPGMEPRDSFQQAAKIIHESEHIWLDDSAQCLESVLACDALISDCSSLLAKAMRFGKSLCYTQRPDSDGAGPATPYLEKYIHTAMDPRDVRRFFTLVARREDPLLPVSDAVLDEFCGVADGRAAARIADNLEQHFFPPEVTR